MKCLGCKIRNVSNEQFRVKKDCPAHKELDNLMRHVNILHTNLDRWVQYEEFLASIMTDEQLIQVVDYLTDEQLNNHNLKVIK